MAISNLLPASGANDNRPNLKQFFGKNPAVANDNVERVSSGMFSDSFVDSIVTTLQGLVDEIAKITNMANSVVASFGAIVKSIKSLNKDVTNRFRVLNSELNASKIDFVKTILNVPKMEAMPNIQGAPMNVNAPAAAKEDGGFDIGDLLANYLGLKGGGAILKTMLGLLTSPPLLLGFLAAGTAIWLAWELKKLYQGLLDSKEFKDWAKHQEGKTEEMMRAEVAKTFAEGNNPKEARKRTEKREGVDKLQVKLPDGSTLDHTMVMGKSTNSKGEEIWVMKDGSGFLNNRENIAAKVGFAAVNVDTGETYSSIDDRTPGHFKGTPGLILPGFPTKQEAAPAPAPAPAPAGPQTSSPAALGQTGAGSFGVSGVTGMGAPSAPAAPPAPTGAPAGEVSSDSNTQPPPPSGRPSMRGAVNAAIPVPPAGPTGAGSAPGGVAVVKNSSVQNVGSTGGAETGNMSGQNLPMFARNPKLQESFGKQVLKEHQ